MTFSWKKIVLAALLPVIIFAGYQLVEKYELAQLIEKIPYNRALRESLNSRLISSNPFPEKGGLDLSAGAIYVLGGTQESMERKFNTAVSLYAVSRSRVLFYSKPGFTEENPSVSNDQWAKEYLTRKSVARADIEAVEAEAGFFGTLNEAKAISAYASEKGLKSLALVSSPYHTKRVSLSFKKYLDPDVKTYIYASQELTSLRELMREYSKLIIYRILLLIK